MKRTLLAALLATGTLASAQSFAAGSTQAIVHYGDENDLSWLYVAPTAKQFPADSGKPVSASPIARFGDENDMQLYVAPTAKQFAESAPAQPITTIVHFGDENDLSWLPTAKRSSRSSTFASTPGATVR